MKCSVDGKTGIRWGHKGKCYTGPGAKEKALRQMRAEHANAKSFKEALSKTDLLKDKVAIQLLDEMIISDVEKILTKNKNKDLNG